MGFDPYNRSLKIRESTMTQIPKVEVHLWRAPKFLVRPKKGPTMLKSESS
jgi:hypothetical protein